MATGYMCEVKQALNCTNTTREDCKTITVEECHERPRPLACETTTLHVPYQPKVHRVKCLLEHDMVLLFHAAI